MARADWIRYIRANAPRYGLDPQAVLAVASAEGLSGAVGDQGTSYGPFQLHRGGALPTGRGRAWAESPAGIDYALRQIQSVARGMRGQQAVSNIVQRFERPADPTGEIARAMGAYGSFGGAVADAVVPQSTPSTRGGGRAPIPYKPGKPQYRTERVFNNANLAQGIFSSLLSGETPNVASLVQGSWGTRRVPIQQPLPPPTAFKPVPQGRPPKGAGKGAIPIPGGWFNPGTGKVIGTPGAGTHTLGNWESDRALDIAMPVGSPIYAPFAGTIGSQFGSLGAPGSSRFAGLRLHVVNPKNEWYGAHLSRFAPGIAPGVRVTPGELLGYSGSASGVAHLHEGLKYGDPYRLIGRR